MQQYSWLKSYPADIKWDVKIEPKTLYSIIDDAAIKFPEKIATDFFGKHLTFAELAKLTDKLAHSLLELGVTKGIRVGLFLPNCPQYIISYFAILKAGGIVVNFSPLYSIDELKHQLVDSGTEIIITFNLNNLYEKVKKLVGVGNLRQIIIAKMEKSLPFPKNAIFPLLKHKLIAKIDWRRKDHISWEKLFKESSGNIKLPEINPLKDVAVLQYTGGTTGVPKGAVLTHYNVYANAMQSVMWFPQVKDGGEKMLAVLPFFHVFAMTTVMNFSLIKGATIIIHPKFEVGSVVKDIHCKKPTLMPAVPTMLTAINNYPELHKYNLSSLKVCISGGGPLPMEVKNRFEKNTGCIVLEGYGLTETSPVVCSNSMSDNKPGSIGLPFPATIVEIEDIDNRGHFLGPNERGELCVRGPQVMQCYWNKPDETAQVLDNEGRFRTGDIAYMDEKGYTYIADRLKEMIIVGGFKVFPKNVEEVIYRHEAVAESAVVGVPDEYHGQAVKAYISFKKGVKLTENELKEFLEPQLGKHEMPVYIEFRESLPKTMIGKISKKDLK